jgi:hypothetical protein
LLEKMADQFSYDRPVIFTDQGCVGLMFHENCVLLNEVVIKKVNKEDDDFARAGTVVFDKKNCDVYDYPEDVSSCYDNLIVAVYSPISGPHKIVVNCVLPLLLLKKDKVMASKLYLRNSDECHVLESSAWTPNKFLIVEFLDNSKRIFWNMITTVINEVTEMFKFLKFKERAVVAPYRRFRVFPFAPLLEHNGLKFMLRESEFEELCDSRTRTLTGIEQDNFVRSRYDHFAIDVSLAIPSKGEMIFYDQVVCSEIFEVFKKVLMDWEQDLPEDLAVLILKHFLLVKD